MAFRSDVEGNHSIASINITPLVDVMLVLLVIFMITAPVLANQVTVHVGTSDRAAPTAEPVTLRVEADGVRWDGQRLTLAALDAQFAYAAKQEPQPAISIDADDALRYEQVAQVLASAERAGIEKIGFAAR